jgi:hypothetical protein
MIAHNAKQAALRSGIPETYAARQGQWLKKHPMVVAALERELDAKEMRDLQKALREIESRMEFCKQLLGLDEL